MVHRTINGTASAHSGEQVVPITPLGAPREVWTDICRADGSHTTRDEPSPDRVYHVDVSVTVTVAVYEEDGFSALGEGEARVRAVADRIVGDDGDMRVVEVEAVECEVGS